MKRIKKKLINQSKFRKIFNENNLNDDIYQKNYLYTDSNSLSKFGKTSFSNFNINKTDFKSRYFRNSIFKEEFSKMPNLSINLKSTHNKINKSNSHIPNNILPYSKNKRDLKNEYIYTNTNNYKSISSNNDSKKNEIKNKYMKFKEYEDDSEKKIYNYKKHNIKEKKDINEDNIYQYSMILKKLDSWDKDHCDENIKKSDLNLFNFLNNYYQKNNLEEDNKKLLLVSNMIKARKNYSYLDEEGNQRNRVILQMIKNREKEAGRILKNNFYKVRPKYGETLKRRYSKLFDYNNDLDSDTIDILIKDKIKSENHNKIINEKIKFEKQLYDELIKINNIILDKKILKDQKTENLKNIFKEKNNLQKEYNEKYNRNRKLFWDAYDDYEHHFKSLISNKEEEAKMLNYGELNDNDESNSDNESNNDDKKNSSKSQGKINIARKKKKKLTLKIKKAIEDNKKEIEEIESIKKFKILNMNNEMNNKLKTINNNFKSQMNDLNEQQKKLEKEIELIKKELEYYKQINDELLRENKLYYLEKLKKGVDCRKDGLMWIVSKLVEFQVPIEYHLFPKFLTHEQIDYLKKCAEIQLKQKELKIIINIMKKKQSTQKMNGILKYMDIIDNIEYVDNNNGTINFGNITNLKNQFFMIAKKKIDKKFIKIYQDNFEIIKNYLNRNIENYEFNNVINEIKKDLYHGSNSAIQKSKKDFFNKLIGDQDNKNFFQFLVDIRTNYNKLEEENEKLLEKEKENYIKLIENNQNQKNTLHNLIKNEMIKKCLFGTRLDK